MEQEAIGFVKWWTKQKMSDKLPIILVIGLIASVTMNFKQASTTTRLQEEKEKQIVECEQRAGTIREIAAKALIIFMERNDSINREMRKEYWQERIDKVTKLTENYKK